MRRSALMTFPIMVSVFTGGGILGFVLTAALTETGSIARLLGLCSLPLAFILGAKLWLGYALVRLLVHLLRRGGWPRFTQSGAIPPGSAAFVFTSVAMSSILGIVVALAPSRLGSLPTLTLFVGLGAGYGILCHRLASNGFLPVYNLEAE